MTHIITLFSRFFFPDASACTLQSYTRRVRDEDGTLVKITARANGRHAVNLGDRNRTIANGTPHRMNGNRTATQTESPSHYANVKQNGRATEIFTTDLDDGMTVITNTRSGQVHYIADGSSNNSKIGTRGSTSASTTPSKSSSTLGTPSHGQDLRRSSSARLEWKEQMRKKHLPAIFVNEAFDTEDMPPSPEKVMNSPKKHTHRVSDLSLYYVSSDYHPDQLVDLAPKLHHQESEGAYNQYDDKDFEYLLDETNAVADTSMSKDIEEAFHNVLSESLKTGLNDEKVLESDLQKEPLSCKADKENGFQTNPFGELNREDSVDSERRESVEHSSSVVSDTALQADAVSTSSFETTDTNMEPKSESSDHSITLEPYTEGRRPPWMDQDLDSSFSAMVEPLIGESDSDTLKDSNGSGVFETAANSDPYRLSDSSPAQFDEETDRGFEAALACNYVYGHSTSLGLCFESIREEPEEMVGEGKAPFSDDEEISAIFKTQAVVASSPSSRADLIRPSVLESRGNISINGLDESIHKEGVAEEPPVVRNGDQCYNEQTTRFDMFYESTYPEEPGDSVNSLGNIEESTSFRTAESISEETDVHGSTGSGVTSAVTDGYGHSGQSLLLTDNNEQSDNFNTHKHSDDPYSNKSMSTFGADKNPFLESNSSEGNALELDMQNVYDPFQPDSSHDDMHSRLAETKEVSYNGFCPWPEELIEMSDTSFDSEFSEVSHDKSNLSETRDVPVGGQMTKSDSVNNQTNHSQVHTAFF